MTQLNEAWWVLSDPVRRFEYDRSQRGPVATGSAAPPSAPTGDELDEAALAAMRRPRHDPLRSYVDRPRFPWKLVLTIIVLGAVVILAFGSLTKPPAEPPLNGLIYPGSCVTVDVRRGEVAQASCSGSYDAVVQELLDFGSTCPQGTQSYRDRQGRGVACVVPATTP